MKLKPNFPACNIANIIIKAAKADTSRSGDALHHIWYDAEKDAGYATDGKRLLRATAADFGVNRDELKTGYYDLAMIDGYPRFIPVKCSYPFPNVEAVIPAGNTVFAEFHYWKKKEPDDQSRQKFLLQMLVFHASRKRYPNDPKCWQTLSEARLDAIDKSGTDWQVMIYENTDPISFKHDTIHFVLMPMRGMGDQQVLKACGLWPEEINETKEN